MSQAIKFIQIYFDLMLSRKLCIEFSFPHRLAYREKTCRSANMNSSPLYGFTSHYKFKICISAYSPVLGIWLAWVTSRHTENTKAVSLIKLRQRPLAKPCRGCAPEQKQREEQKEVTVGLGFVPNWGTKRPEPDRLFNPQAKVVNWPHPPNPLAHDSRQPG